MTLPLARREPPLQSQVDPRGIRREFLTALARHTDGIGWVQVLTCLERRGVLEALVRTPEATELSTLCERFGANLGYLGVVVRVLALQGWLDRQTTADPRETRVSLTPTGRALFDLFETQAAPRRVSAFLPVASNARAYLEGRYSPPAGVPSLAEMSWLGAERWGLNTTASGPAGEAASRLADALDGNLVGPVAIALANDLSALAPHGGRKARASYLGSPGREPVERRRAALEVLARAGWLRFFGARASLTELGRYAVPRLLAYGVPVSYLPLYEHVEPLLFGDAAALWQRAPGEPERLVDRALNVRASGSSHRRYFASADDFVVDAFNRPGDQQPLGFCDMGCGDGSWLEHVWQLIVERTRRGRLMREFPRDSRYVPLMVGADYNEAARQATRERLTAAAIPHRVIFGDVNDPERLDQDLRSDGVDARRLMHGSSFLVHNRPFIGVQDPQAAARRAARSSGAYAWRGRPVSNAELEQNLVEFFGRWRPLIGPAGMLVIELHDPEVAVPGKTLTNYVLSHGLSDQLTVGRRAFLDAAAEAGLRPSAGGERYFPRSESEATISVTHFRGGAASPRRHSDAASTSAVNERRHCDGLGRAMSSSL